MKKLSLWLLLLITSPILFAGLPAAGTAEAAADRIWQHIHAHWQLPDGIRAGLSCDIALEVTHQGYLLEIDLEDCTEAAALQKSAIEAVARSLPLPMPVNEATYRKLRNLTVTFRTET